MWKCCCWWDTSFCCGPELPVSPISVSLSMSSSLICFSSTAHEVRTIAHNVTASINNFCNREKAKPLIILIAHYIMQCNMCADVSDKMFVFFLLLAERKRGQKESENLSSTNVPSLFSRELKLLQFRLRFALFYCLQSRPERPKEQVKVVCLLRETRDDMKRLQDHIWTLSSQWKELNQSLTRLDVRPITHSDFLSFREFLTHKTGN